MGQTHAVASNMPIILFNIQNGDFRNEAIKCNMNPIIANSIQDLKTNCSV
jgi:hypothetical protein